MIKLIVLDFDGVIASLKEVHYEALNKALLQHYQKPISREDHISKYDGLSTRRKLETLVGQEGYHFLDDARRENIEKAKQLLTSSGMEKHLKEDTRLSEMLFHLSESYILVVASNAVEETVKLGLKLLKIEEYISFVYSNKSVTNIKPNPEIYLAAMMEAGVSPAETLIVEDSKHGREAAMASGAHVCGVDSPEDLLTGDKLERAIERAN